MRYTRIDVEGSEGRYASLTRKLSSEYIEVEMILPDQRTKHHVLAECMDDKWSMAEGLQEILEGCRGTNTDVREYYTALNYLSD